MVAPQWSMPNLEMSDSEVTYKVVHRRIPHWGTVNLENASYLSSMTLTAICLWFASVMTPRLPDILISSLSLSAHYSAFQSAEIVNPLAIRSFIKELYSDEGNKGD